MLARVPSLVVCTPSVRASRWTWRWACGTSTWLPRRTTPTPSASWAISTKAGRRSDETALKPSCSTRRRPTRGTLAPCSTWAACTETATVGSSATTCVRGSCLSGRRWRSTPARSAGWQGSTTLERAGASRTTTSRTNSTGGLRCQDTPLPSSTPAARSEVARASSRITSWRWRPSRRQQRGVIARRSSTSAACAPSARASPQIWSAHARASSMRPSSGTRARPSRSGKLIRS
mmetsp:Transcript_16489/g.34440  ORF Transcript_16489/g.34440 Transcript_16489/m.34440 type:complete len:233 (+) Transcript_16489:219-917(+)